MSACTGMSFVKPPEVYGGDGRFPVAKKVVFKDVEKREKEEKGLDSCNSASESSSIGKNSDISEKSLDNFDENEEVQSSYKGPLDAMDALEEVLPIRRGISRFYNGKSKSFASLAGCFFGIYKEPLKTRERVHEETKKPSRQ
ncbi:Uncharacterized protein Adt_40058 [Abeliophyllum distichum]|uniref:Uncharacterized protein n=1 Tax=Abeliophyllum distichum TaxID=126358 RepID=A0ABD1Q7X6_9LAMI